MSRRTISRESGPFAKIDRGSGATNDHDCLDTLLHDMCATLLTGATKSGRLTKTQSEIARMLKNIGVAPILPALGELFNPRLHKEIDQYWHRELGTEFEGRVHRVVHAGFSHGYRIVIPAAVVVLRRPASSSSMQNGVSMAN